MLPLSGRHGVWGGYRGPAQVMVDEVEALELDAFVISAAALEAELSSRASLPAVDIVRETRQFYGGRICPDGTVVRSHAYTVGVRPDESPSATGRRYPRLTGGLSEVR